MRRFIFGERIVMRRLRTDGNHQYRYTILWCPDEEYLIGASFPANQVVLGLRYRNWPPDTIFRVEKPDNQNYWRRVDRTGRYLEPLTEEQAELYSGGNL